MRDSRTVDASCLLLRTRLPREGAQSLTTHHYKTSVRGSDAPQVDSEPDTNLKLKRHAPGQEEVTIQRHLWHVAHQRSVRDIILLKLSGQVV